MDQYKLHNLVQDIFDNEIWNLLKRGQEEYASSNDAFSNFKRQGKELDMDPKIVLWIHAMKHKSGIASYLKGVKSQREDVRGRINDLIVYLLILRGIIDEESAEGLKKEEKRTERGLAERVEESAERVIQKLSTGMIRKREQEKPKTD